MMKSLTFSVPEETKKRFRHALVDYGVQTQYTLAAFLDVFLEKKDTALIKAVVERAKHLKNN
jgi:hypothetical protein